MKRARNKEISIRLHCCTINHVGIVRNIESLRGEVLCVK
jgi:hypothetical protein